MRPGVGGWQDASVTEDPPGPLPPDAAPAEQAGDEAPATGGPALKRIGAHDAAARDTPLARQASPDRRWLDRMLWFWPLVVLGILTLAGQLLGAFGVAAASVAAVSVIVMAVGGATFERPTKTAILAVTTALIGIAFLAWQT